jgi:hypothetical protein
MIARAHFASALGPSAVELDRACLAHLLRKGAARHKPRLFQKDI